MDEGYWDPTTAPKQAGGDDDDGGSKRGKRKKRKAGTWGVIDSFEWLRRAREALRGCEAGAMAVAIYIQCKYAMDDKEPVVVSTTAMEAWGVTRKQVAHAVTALEAYGLTSSERSLGCSPRVRVIPVPEE